MNWIYRLQLRAKQKRILYELEMDLKWLETFKGGVIDANENELRTRIMELQSKETKTEEELCEIDSIAGTIAELKVVRSRYQQTQNNVKELKDYIEMLS